MAITKYLVTDTWQAVTAAGEAGTCWLLEKDTGKVGQGDVVIYHTDGTAPTGDLKLDESKQVFTPISNNDIMQLSADNASDVYYARCRTAGSKANLLVDVV